MRQSADEAVAEFVVYHVEGLGVGEAGVDAVGDGDGQFTGLGGRDAEEVAGVLGRGGVAFAQGGVDESFAESFGLEVPAHEEEGGEGIVDFFPVVAVVGGVLLLSAVDVEGKSVGVDDAVVDAPVTDGALVAGDHVGEGISDGLEVFGVFEVGESFDESGIRL